MIEQNNKTNMMIYKSNSLIESSYNLTASENKLICLAMCKLNTIILEKNLNLEEVKNKIKTAQFDLINISVTEYRKTFNIKSNNIYNQLQKVAKSLYNKEVLYVRNCDDNENEAYGSKRWVITCEYIPHTKSISLEFHPSMIKDLLVFQKQYTGFLFDEFAITLKKKYSFRIYELCKQYLKIGKRDFIIDDLRFKLCINDDEYKQYRDLKKMLLDCIKEINNTTDIRLEYEEIEKISASKKVTKIRFIIKPQNHQLSIFNEETGEHQIVPVQNQVAIISELIHKKVTPQQAIEILTTALKSIDSFELNIGVTDYIKEKVEVCENYIIEKGAKNYIALLLSALKHNWVKAIKVEATAPPIAIPEKTNKKVTGVSPEKFNNFEPRTMDYDYLDKVIDGSEEYDPNQLYPDGAY